jgi:hypothetical protein
VKPESAGKRSKKTLGYSKEVCPKGRGNGEDLLAVMSTKHLAVLVKTPNQRSELGNIGNGHEVEDGRERAEIGEEGMPRSDHVGVLTPLLPLPLAVEQLQLQLWVTAISPRGGG